MIDPVVRVARDHDVDDLILLESTSRAALLDARGGRRWLDEHLLVGDGWGREISDPSRVVFVADLEGYPVGFLVVVFEPDGTARIDQVFVLVEARHLGFGDAMMATAVAAARGRSCVRIEGEALPGDRETKNLYERARITARLIVVSSELEPI
jgi:GNAT superfamily N-acetyltransferase